MNLDLKVSMKLLASCAAFLFLGACAQNQNTPSVQASSSACIQPRSVQEAIQQALSEAPVENGSSQLLIRLAHTDLDLKDLKEEIRQEDPQVKVKRVDHRTLAVEIPSDSVAMALLERYLDQEKITHIEPDTETFLLEPAVAPLDLEALSSNVESLTEAVSGDQAQDQSQEDTQNALSEKEIVVAVIDSGIDYTHKELLPHLWRNTKEIPDNGIDDDGNGYIDDQIGWDFVNEDNKPMADDVGVYHGTHVSGIVKSASKMAKKGLNIKIMPLKYLNAQAVGKTSNAIRAIDYAINNGAIILNGSWGSFNYSDLLFDAMKRVRAARALFVAAAGNDGVDIDQSPFYPAAYALNNIISVAAVDQAGVLAPWSNYGTLNVDVAAPGVKIKSLSNGGATRVLSGTSMAAPYISGVAAMLWAHRPDLSFAEIRKVIFSTAVEKEGLAGKLTTKGAVHVASALEMAQAYVHDPNDEGVPEVGPNYCLP